MTTVSWETIRTRPRLVPATVLAAYPRSKLVVLTEHRLLVEPIAWQVRATARLDSPVYFTLDILQVLVDQFFGRIFREIQALSAQPFLQYGVLFC